MPSIIFPAKKFEKVKAIFFDLNDTLYSSQEMEAAYPQKAAELIGRERNITLAEAKKLLKETSEKLKTTEKHVTKVRAMAELGFSRKQVHDEFCQVDPAKFLQKDEQLEEVMEQLAQKYKLGIISNSRKSHLIKILKALGLSDKWFSLLVTEDIVQEVKPALEPFLKAVELSGCAANECVYIGDSLTKDIRPAKEVDMMTVLVSQRPAVDELAHADASVRDVKDILELFRRKGQT